MSKEIKPEEIPVETYAEHFGEWVGKIMGYALRAMSEGRDKRGPEILQDVIGYTTRIAQEEIIPTTMETLGITMKDIREKPFETYRQVFGFLDRVLGCKTIEWTNEGPDSMIEIARNCWLMTAVKQYPEICAQLINAISTAIRQKLWPDLEMEVLEMVPMGNAPDYCKVRVKIEKK